MKVKVLQSCQTLCDPIDYRDHGILQARILQWVAFPFSRGSSQPRNWTRSPTLKADSLPAEPQGKPENAGVGSLLLLQWIFPTQESNWCLLHYKQILYQPTSLSYQGSPKCLVHSWKRWTVWSSGEKLGMDRKLIGIPYAFTKVSRWSSEIGYDLLRTDYEKEQKRAIFE